MANTKWEYLSEGYTNPLKTNLINTHGESGWELVTIVKGNIGEYVYTFKRPIMDSDLSSIIQVTDKERLLIDFLQWQSISDTANTTYKEDVANYLKSINGV